MNNTTNKFTIGQIVKYNDTLSDTHNQNNKYPLYKILGIGYDEALIENLKTKRRFLTSIDKLTETCEE